MDAFRILVIDDNEAIHQDFIKILTNPEHNTHLAKLEQALFNKTQKEISLPIFEISAASQGKEGVESIKKALDEEKPFALVFVDIRMPPGWDGIETVKHIWKLDKSIQIVICTAYSDYSWEETIAELGKVDNLLILKKPFDQIEVKQLACTLAKKWEIVQEANQDANIKDQIADTLFSPQKIPSSLKNALANEELYLCYQPEYKLKTGKIIAVEALLRWHHPEKGILMPLDFIPEAEKSGLIVAIGDWTISTACLQNKAWQNAGFVPIRVTVNVTEKQFEHQNILESVKDALALSQLQPKYLEIELKESSLHGEDMINTIKALKKIGVSIAIDDFGTGHTSLDFLKKIPVDRIKIDSSIIQRIKSEGDDEAKIYYIIDIAKKLNADILAEGVENNSQLTFLKANDCGEVQGFYFNEPLISDEVSVLLKRITGKKSLCR